MGQPSDHRLSGLSRVWPEQGHHWALLFAVLYLAAFYTVGLTPSWLEVFENRVHLLYLPAFVRIAAVMVAGLAGVVGVFVGSLACGLLIIGDGLSVSALNAASSALAPALAWLLVISLYGRAPTITLPSLMIMGFITALISPVLHSVYWLESGAVPITLQSTIYMMVGDFGGVLVGFLFLRYGLLRCQHCMKRLMAWLTRKAEGQQ